MTNTQSFRVQDLCRTPATPNAIRPDQALAACGGDFLWMSGKQLPAREKPGRLLLG